MSLQAVLMPLFVQVALTFALWFWMVYERGRLLAGGKVQPHEIALRQPNWPPHALQVGNAAHNQLETPLLFYLLTTLALVTRQADATFVVLAWIYVVLRVLHAYVHVTSNRIPVRGPAFAASLLVLFVMWVVFALRILTRLP
ncbi:MAG: MAPEG family protein [Pseudolabrys sp.]|nr:MAPEG family protein [Pseudolabrys sp.]